MPLGNVPYSARILSFTVVSPETAVLTVGVYSQSGVEQAIKNEVSVAASSPETRYDDIIRALQQCRSQVMSEETGGTLAGMLQGMVSKFTNADWARVTQ